MARTRTTLRRIDPWSMLKFGFVVNLVLLGIELLLAMIVWTFVQRLELIDRVCDLAVSIGFQECGVDGGALFDTVLVLGLLGVVIQTGIIVFMTFLANLIFDLTGGIVVTLEDDRAAARGQTLSAGNRRGRGVGRTGSRSEGSSDSGDGNSTGASRTPPAPLGTTPSSVSGSSSESSGSHDATTRAARPWPGDQLREEREGAATTTAPSESGEDTGEDLFGNS